MTRAAGNVRALAGDARRAPTDGFRRASVRDAAPYLLVLPALAAAWPGPLSIVRGNPVPTIAATGLALLASLPLLGLALHRRARPPRAAAWLLLPLAAGAIALVAGRITDTAEAWRTAQWTVVAAAALTGGALLDERGKLTFARLCVLGTLLWGATALYSDGHAGALGNTGTTNQLLLPGAVLGGWFAATRRPPWSVLGLAAALVFTAHAALAPVLAGGLALVAALVLSGALSPWSAKLRTVRRTFGLLAAAVLFALVAPHESNGAAAERAGEQASAAAVALPGVPAGPAPASESGERATLEGDLRGVEVRARIWSRLPALLVDHALVGTGPGQFAAAFPPYRDPLEAELSRLAGAGSAVEHPHADAFVVAAEEGLLGAIGWWVFLALAAGAAVTALRERNVTHAALGAALLAVLVNGLVHAPLARNTPAAVLGFALAGVLLGPALRRGRRERSGIESDGETSPRAGRLAPALLLAAGLALLPSALAAVQHGRALTALVTRLGDVSVALESGDLEQAARAQSEARSALARAAAHVSEAGFTLPEFAATQGTEAERIWADVLARRPHSIRALTATAILYARDGRVDEARAAFERAVELAPGRSDLRRNLLLLELQTEHPQAALAQIEALRERGQLDTADLRRITGDQVFRARYENAAELLSGCPELGAFSRPPFGEECFAESEVVRGAETELEAEDERWADALEAHAHRSWAREHHLGGDAAATRRSLRQALRLVRKHAPGSEGEAVLAEQVESGGVWWTSEERGELGG